MTARSVLYVDMAFTHDMVVRGGKHGFFETRHSEGYFDKVWGVHPISDVAGSGSRAIQTFVFSPDQVIIEGVSRCHDWPKLLAPLDFLVSQARLLRMLARLIRSEKIDLIVATDPFFSGLFGAVLKRLSGRPLVICIYSNQDDIYHRFGVLASPRLLPWFGLQNFVARMILRYADMVLGGTQYYLDWAVAKGASRARGGVLPIARNIEPCHLADPAGRGDPNPLFKLLGVPVEGRHMIMVSRLIALKFAEDGVRAMVEAATIDPRAIGIVAGSGPLLPRLERIVADAGLTARIRFVGQVTQQQLAVMLPHCVTVSPLTGMALVESGLGGSPVVAYDIDWHREFIDDGVNGFLVPASDYRAMGRKIAEIIGDDALRERLSRAMRSIALARADRATIAASEKASFDRVLSPRGAAAAR